MVFIILIPKILCFKRRLTKVRQNFLNIGSKSEGGEIEFGKTQTNPGSIWQWASDKGVISGVGGGW